MALLKIKGWKGVLKTLAVTFLCFQIYFLLTKCSAFQSAECAALNYPHGSPPLLNEIAMEIFSGVWAVFYVVTIIIYQKINSNVFG